MRHDKVYNRPLVIKDIIKHIKSCNRKGIKYNFLGLVEVNDINYEVEELFKVISSIGQIGYDWINGNSKLNNLIKQIIGE